MSFALSNLKPSRPVDEIWDKEKLKSFQEPLQPDELGDDPFPEPVEQVEPASRDSMTMSVLELPPLMLALKPHRSFEF